MLLNKFPKDLPSANRQQLEKEVPLKIQDSQTYLHKYLQAVAANKMKKDMYVTQVNSIEQL